MISIVIPFYNEEKRLREYFDPFFERMCRALDEFECIAVDDGSTDRTREMLLERAVQNPQLVVAGYPVNQGRSAAVRTGMFEAKGDLIWETDADASYDVSQCIVFQKYLDVHPECDMLIATREHRHSRAVVNQPPLRILAGKGFRWLFRTGTGITFSDVMAGCKMYRRDAAADIFAHQYDNRHVGPAETVYVATRRGYTVHELPVTWTDISTSNIKYIRDTIQTLKGLMGIVIRTLQGKYGSQ